jgi:hypothetical protein
LIRLQRPYDLARDRDALILAGLLSTLLHLALLRWLVSDWQAPAAYAPLPEAEIVLASPSDIGNDRAPLANADAARAPAKSLPEIQARLPPAAPPPQEQPQPGTDAWAQSRAILSSQELADPRNRKTVETLKHLEPQTRSQQLCDFEAILQINRQINTPSISSSPMRPRPPFEKATP